MFWLVCWLCVDGDGLYYCVGCVCCGGLDVDCLVGGGCGGV